MPHNSKLLFLNEYSNIQRGQALLALLVLLTVGAGAAFYTLIRPASSAMERDKITAAALAQAKSALIGYAVAVDLSGAGRPGDLPCPDRDDDGDADAVPICNGAALGRLPWKTLGLPDLRDGDGERLWYAVSSSFKNNPRTDCAAPGDAGCLNSDSRGTITIRNSAGTVIHDGANPDAFTPSGVIAVIFAPGAALRRQGAGASQDRSCTGGSCTTAGVCNSSPTTLTAKCNPVNYLDVLNGVEDNAGFTDGSATDGFINGVIRDANNNVIVNDRLITITYSDLMPVLQRRVAKEVLNCLNDYAALPQNGGGPPTYNGRYPWAAPVATVTYADTVDTRFGRVPDNPLSATQLGVAGGVADSSCPASPTVCMSTNWPVSVSCSITQGTWWNNWKEMVFYGVADAYKPADPVSGGGVPPSGGCGGCLTVNNDTPSPYTNKRVVVVVAGKRLSGVAGGQPRSIDKGTSTNYLENDNDGGTNTSQNTFGQHSTTASFNDLLLYQ